jgi:hypothetical protein
MANGGIIGPINDPTQGYQGDLTTTFTASGTYTSPIRSRSLAMYFSSSRWRWWWN